MLKHKKHNEKEKTASILSNLNNLVDTINSKNDKLHKKRENITKIHSNYHYHIPNMNKPIVFSTIKPVIIFMFQIRFAGLYPFLLFLLQKQKDNTLTFINYPSFDGRVNDKKMINNCIIFIKQIYPKLIISYKGFYETSYNNIIILESNNSENEDIHTNNINEDIWSTIHEIVNIEKVYNYQINKSVVDLFIKNPKFLFLKDDYNNNYETPIVGYYTQKKNIKFACFDIYRETLIPSIGKCYNFYVNIPEKNENENIMRFIIFTENILLFNNLNIENTNALLGKYNNKQMFFIKKYDNFKLLSIMS